MLNAVAQEGLYQHLLDKVSFIKGVRPSFPIHQVGEDQLAHGAIQALIDLISSSLQYIRLVHRTFLATEVPRICC